MERFADVINGFQPLTIFAKHSILDVWQGSEYFSVLYKDCCLQDFLRNLLINLQAVGIVGAVIMPHNFYLHSALVKVS